MAPDPTTLGFIQGRLDTLADRINFFSAHYQHPHFENLLRPYIEHARAHLPKLTPEIVQTAITNLTYMRSYLPKLGASIMADPRCPAPFHREWAHSYPEMDQFLVFIINRLPSLLEDEEPPRYAPPTPVTPEHYRPAPLTHDARRASLPRPVSVHSHSSHGHAHSLSQTQVYGSPARYASASRPVIPSPEDYPADLSGGARPGAAYGYPPPKTHAQSYPSPASLTSVPAPAPTPQRQQQYAAAPIPRHLQHLYARPATPGSGGSYAP